MAESMKIDDTQEDQAPEPQEEQPSSVEESAPEAPAPDAVKCPCCEGEMVRDRLPRFSRGFGIVIAAVGLVLSSLLSLLLGLPLVVIGAYMATATRSVWTCDACGAVVDRHGI